MTSGNETFAQVSSVQYDFNGSPRKVSTTWHRSHWKYKQSCCKDIIVQEKSPSSSSPRFPKRQIWYIVFSRFTKARFWLTERSRNARRPLKWGRKLSNYIAKGLEICTSFFSWFSTYLKQVMFNRMGFTSTRFGVTEIY